MKETPRPTPFLPLQKPEINFIDFRALVNDYSARAEELLSATIVEGKLTKFITYLQDSYCSSGNIRVRGGNIEV